MPIKTMTSNSDNAHLNATATAIERLVGRASAAERAANDAMSEVSRLKVELELLKSDLRRILGSPS